MTEDERMLLEGTAARVEVIFYSVVVILGVVLGGLFVRIFP